MLEQLLSDEEEFYLKIVPIDISQKLISRLYLQHHKVSDKADPKEKCTEDDLLRYPSFAKEGFIFSFRADKEGIFPINHFRLLRYTWPYQGKMWEDIFDIIETNKKIALLEKPTLPVFHQFLTTLHYLEKLSMKEQVSLENLEVCMPFAKDFDPILKKQTYWKYNITPEFVWDTIKEFEKTLSEVLLTDQNIPLNRLLKTTHFFTATVDLYTR